MMNAARPHQRRSRGFSIIETLIALVVLSIGMLGIAALYVESLRAGRSAIYRTQAVNLATDLADHIRANRRAGNAYRLGAADPAPARGTCAPMLGVASTNCSPTQLATDDLARWREAIQQQLPGGGTAGIPRGTVVVTPSAGGVTNDYTISITWAEPGARDAQGMPLLTYVLNMQI